MDGFVILEAELEEPSHSHKAAKIGAEAGDVETGSSGVFAGTLVLGLQAKSAVEELAADQPMTRLQPNQRDSERNLHQERPSPAACATAIGRCRTQAS